MNELGLGWLAVDENRARITSSGLGIACSSRRLRIGQDGPITDIESEIEDEVKSGEEE